MDEEDGRPGALAAQAGQPDAHLDALPLSLCINNPNLTDRSLPIPTTFRCLARPSCGPWESNIKKPGRSPQCSPITPQPHGPKAIGPTAGGGEKQ